MTEVGRPSWAELSATHRRVAVLLSLAGLAMVAFSWALASPPTSEADGDHHLATVWCADGNQAGRCEELPDGTFLVPGIMAQQPCYLLLPDASASCLWGPASETMVATARLAHPPGAFAKAMSLLVRDSVAESVLLMRLANIGLGVLAIAGAYWVSAASARFGLLMSWMLLLVPLTVFTWAGMNSSSWSIIGLGTYWAFAIALLSKRTSGRKTVVAVCGVVAAAFLGTARVDSAVFSVVVTVAVLLMCSPYRLRDDAWRLLFVLLVTLSLWFSYPSPGGAAGGAAPQPGLQPRLLLENLLQVPTLLHGIWGAYGWANSTVLPGVVHLSGVIATAAVVFLAMRFWRGRYLIAVAIVGVAAVALPLAVLQLRGFNVGVWVQPRYYLPFVLASVGIMLSGPGPRRAVDLAPIQAGALFLSATTANAVALHIQYRRYLTGLDEFHVNLNAHIEWWWAVPFSPMLAYLLGVVGCCAFVVGVLMHGVVLGDTAGTPADGAIG